jgi:hypothetical protein
MTSVITLAIFVATVIIMLIAFEFGFRLVIAIKRSGFEKESPVSAISASILGLLAFMLAFTFGIVTDRYNERKALVRQEANAIGTAYLRSDILPDAERNQSRELLKKHVEINLKAAHSQAHILQHECHEETERIHHQLWNLALVNARRDLNSDIGALYMEAINAVIDMHGLRVAVVEGRIPRAIWGVLYILVFLGMSSVGYQTAISGSKRSWMILVLALSFSLVIGLIASLDRPQTGFIHVSQKPLVDVLTTME